MAKIYSEKKMKKDIIKQMEIEGGYLIHKMVPHSSQRHIANCPSKSNSASILQVNHNSIYKTSVCLQLFRNIFNALTQGVCL